MVFRPFRRVLRLVPISSSEKYKDDVAIQRGGKIVLGEEHLKPVLGAKYRKRISKEDPATFRLTCRGKTMHCSVLEFSHDKKDEILVPDWFFKNLDVQIGQKVFVTLVNLEEACFIRFKSPIKGLEMPSADVMLVQQLSRFAAITKGDKIPICFQGKDHDLVVQETRPANAVRLGQFGAKLEVEMVYFAKEREEAAERVQPTKGRETLKRKAEDESETAPKRTKSEPAQNVDQDLVREARMKHFESRKLDNINQ